MINGKQRSYLKALANKIDATCYIGKDDLTDNVLTEIDRGLEANELIKIKIQESSVLDPKETANMVCEKLKAEFVQAIGRKFVIYRQAKKKEDRKIELPR